MTSPAEDLVPTINATIRRAVTWLAPRVTSEGELSGSENVVFAYYKGLLAFAASGCQKEAERLSRKIGRSFYQAGAFNTGAAYASATVGPVYRDSWLTWGMHHLGEYDMSIPAADFLERRLHPDTGAAASGLAAGDADIADAGLTCCALTALLATGRHGAALRGANTVLDIINGQPHPERALMFRWSRKDGYASSPVSGAVIDTTAEGQVYWYLGYCMVLMANMFRVTADPKWIEGGLKLLSFVDRCRPEVFACTSNGKIAWGAAELFAVTGSAAFARLAARMAAHLCASQTDEGTWYRFPGQELPVTFDATFERVYYLQRVARSLQHAAI